MTLLERLESLVFLFDEGGCVYLLTCVAPGPDEGKGYVGLTTQEFSSRLDGHIVDAYFGSDSRNPLQIAIARHRPFARWFKCEQIGTASSWGKLRELEVKYISEYGTHVSTGRGFNLTWGGEGWTPVSRMKKRVEICSAGWRCDLDAAHAWAMNQIKGRYGASWDALSDSEKDRIMEDQAITEMCLRAFREKSTEWLVNAADQTVDPSVMHALQTILRRRRVVKRDGKGVSK